MLQADEYNHLLRRVVLSSGLVTTIAGNLSGTVGTNNFGHADGANTAASFYHPHCIAVDGNGTFAIVVRLMNENYKDVCACVYVASAIPTL